MKILLVLRGIPASGKSTWIKERELEQYTLSTDNIRLLFAAPEQTPDGRYAISSKYDKQVWAFFRERLEDRMKNGDFTVLDATHTKESYLKDYKKLCKEYNYRMVIVDFSSVDLDIIKENIVCVTMGGVKTDGIYASLMFFTISQLQKYIFFIELPN